jgi:glycosyltransferase involved in cell wall biosynthesis
MRRCLDSIAIGERDVEIIIVNDGSTDGTGVMAEEYAERFPGNVHVIHQENGGHGVAIMAGLERARGLHFKVVDSDDWVDEAAFATVLGTLRSFREMDEPVDLVISNYVYEKPGESKAKAIRYSNALPVGRTFTWDDMGRLKKWQYVLMHAIIYRTEVLRSCGLRLPGKTFYVDNLYAYIPMQYVKTIHCIDADFYRYFIGRDDQSVNEAVMMKRIDQQLKVNRLMIQSIDLLNLENGNIRRFLAHYLEIVTVVSCILLIKSGLPENINKRNALWTEMKQQNPYLHQVLSRRLLCRLVNLSGKIGRSIALSSYETSRWAIGFN